MPRDPKGPRPGFIVRENREQKAAKIKAVLARCCKLDENTRLLDVGCGTGEIAHVLAESAEVHALDIMDQRTCQWSDVRFRIFDGVCFPYPSEYFDVVISNHVIEHTTDPEGHLREIYRVLRGGGIAYFATPNRLYPQEVHHRVVFLHYLPQPVFLSILKMIGLYHEDLELLFRWEMEALFRSTGFDATEMTVDVLRHPEQYHAEVGAFKGWPHWLLRALCYIAQTNIFLLRKEPG